MLSDDDMLQGFLEEAREHLSTIEPDLLSLEENPSDIDTLNRLFRSVHSIKGGAGFFGLENISKLSHVMENLMSKGRTGQIQFTRTHIDVLLQGLDRLNTMVDDIVGSHTMDISSEVSQIEALDQGGVSAPAKPKSAPEPAAPIAATPEAVPPAAPLAPKVEPTPAAAPPQPIPAQPIPAGVRVCRFEVSPEDLKHAVSHGMNLYAVTAFLQRDIMARGKTPYQFISELEELGRFLDSFLDVEGANPIATEEGEDLLFTFLFASIMDPEVASEGLGLNQDQVSLVDPEQLRSGTVELQVGPSFIQVGKPKAVAPTPAAPAPSPAPTAPAPTPQPIAPEAPAPVAEPVIAFPEPTAAAPLPAPLSGKASKRSRSSQKAAKSDESIRVSVSKLNKLVDMAGELVLVRNQLLQVGERAGRSIPGLGSMMQGLNIVTTELQEEILNTRMQPISTVFGKFPRLIRELGTSLGKDILLITEGGEVELDKTVLEALSDPLTHIIRNTADHGIELPEERKKIGKSPQGNLLLKAYHESGQVIIEVSDNGRGIDPEKVVRKAIEKGLVRQEDYNNMSHREKINLIFLPGFSTAEKVSSVSGRGVGMDVVRSNIESIGGSVELISQFGQGTTIKMTLPLTMAIVSCLIVQSEGQRFAIPQINLEELVMLKPEDYTKNLGYVQEKEVLKLRGELLPLISMAEGFGIPMSKEPAYKRVVRDMHLAKKTSAKKALEEEGYRLVEMTGKDLQQEAVRILIISVGVNKVGIIVDSIVGSEEIVVKPMPEYLKHLQQFSGATILGDGTVALIIDTLGFVQKNQLFFTDYKRDQVRREEGPKHHTETQSLLVFDNGTEEQFAITIPLIQRVDDVDLKDIQHVGEKEYLEYRGAQMRILRLEDFLPIQKPSQTPDVVNMIIPKETRIPLGILIHNVIDTKNMEINVTEGAIHTEGILGSTLIDGKITLLLDLYAILEMGEPDALHRVVFTPKTIQKSKILLVEDTPLFLTIVREYLTSVGLQVTTAINGQEALAALDKEYFDLVLSDIEMPIMDGFGLIQQIRANPNFKQIPVIALTSLSDDETIDKGIKAGFNAWLIKLDKEQILSTINQYLS